MEKTSEIARKLQDFLLLKEELSHAIIEPIQNVPPLECVKYISNNPNIFTINSSQLIRGDLSPSSYDIPAQTRKLIELIEGKTLEQQISFLRTVAEKKIIMHNKERIRAHASLIKVISEVLEPFDANHDIFK